MRVKSQKLVLANNWPPSCLMLASFAASPFSVLCHTVNKIKYGKNWRNKERKNKPSKKKESLPASLSRVTVAQWWHSENERGLLVDGRSLTGNKATGCLRIADLLHASLERYYHTMAFNST